MVCLKWTPARSRTAGVVTAGMLVAVAECGLGSPGPVSCSDDPHLEVTLGTTTATSSMAITSTSLKLG